MNPSSPRVQHTRQRILAAAAPEFSARGYAGATTRGIAAAAGISELTLFRHFGNKKNLFLAVMGENSPLPGMQSGLERLAPGDLRTGLQRIGLNFLVALLARRREIIITLREAEDMPELRPIIAQMPLRQRRMLAAFLDRHAAQGGPPSLDSSLAAQAFLGMLFAYAIEQPLLDGVAEAAIPLEDVVNQFVEIFLAGIQFPERDRVDASARPPDHND